MAHFISRDGNILVGGNALGGMTSSSLSISHELADDTSLDSTGGWKEFLYDESELTVSIECLRDEADTAQDALRSAATGKTTVTLIYEPKNSGSYDRITITGYVTSHEVSMSRGEVVTDTFELSASGSPTFDTQ